MADLLLEALLDRDIDWLVTAGQQQTLDENAVLVHQGEVVNVLYIVLGGQLISAVADDQDSVLGQAFSALSGNANLEHILFPLEGGDVFGEMAVLHSPPSPMVIRTEAASTVLVVPQAQLQTKLIRDREFASRFYRVMATLMLDRYEFLLDKFIYRRGLQLSAIQDGPVIFGELFDSDIDWMINHGSVVHLRPEERLIQSGRPTDTLYVVLRGLLSTSITGGKSAALTQIFSQFTSGGQSEEYPGREVARSSRGEVVGETTLIDSRLSKFSVSAINPSTLLAIPRRDLFIKLQQDAGMATRFYRVLTILLSARLNSFINRLGYGKASYQVGQSLSPDVHYEDELDLDLIDHLTVGGARFEWMLKRLKVDQS
ncbi:cyclic nucleotide-binding domain-containing protein [Oscillatoria sp. CS-180]|uniref:cyclic nucleotide-binding domain-containing protein n=1 Tax=Oscillatoria sp. CS-180 TaxID=3021720 RepID=UPI00232E3938|nr:cyclic nucleotide-binding domain-containing protein [Oscillatoria sp. CS-180]MDB9524594.1 cyclic nucleotide-binding domain-containing protein [Oscillatoria sp. CS-180]